MCCQINPDEIEWATLWNPRLYIENVIGEHKGTASLSLEYTGADEALIVERWRCKSTFLENLELLEFPFDVQVMFLQRPGDVSSTYT